MFHNGPTVAISIPSIQFVHCSSAGLQITNETKEMCGTTDSSFQSSNTLNNTGVWSLIELVSLYTVPLSTLNGFSRLKYGTADSKIFELAHHFRIESERPIISKLRRALIWGPP